MTRSTETDSAESRTLAVPRTFTRMKSPIEPHSWTNAAVWTRSSVPSKAASRAWRSQMSASTKEAPAAWTRGADAIPILRRRLRGPPSVTAAAALAGPGALAVLRPRTKARDAVLFALQMWAFTVIHEMPYDDPDRLRQRLKVRYPIALDRALGLGELPNVRLQRAFSTP